MEEKPRRFQLRRLLSRPIASGVLSGRQALRWIGLALIIGGLAGLGAILFDVAIRVATDVLLGGIAGAHPPLPVGDGETELYSADRRWLIPIITTAGGFISGLIVLRFAPETGGGGNEEVISAYHYAGGDIRHRVAPSKLVASVFTIGSGGSAGREGPMAQISAGLAASVAKVLHLTTAERRMCVLMGLGAGIGAIFRAPLGGAVLATEMLYRDDMESDAVIPVLISSIISYSIFSSYAGWTPLFGDHPEVVFNQPLQLIYFVIIGTLAGLLGILYSRTYYESERRFRQLRLPPVVKPAIGGLIVGLIALEAPQVLETGYGWVQLALDERVMTIPLGILLILPVLKIIATSMTVGSGSSGGLFGPGMVIGAMLGAGFWRLFHDVLPFMPDSPASFTLIGMVAHFGAVAHVPLAVMIMVAEMTRNLALLAPAMVAVGVATFVVGQETIFRSQVSGKSDSPVHRHRYAFPLLASLSTLDATEVPSLVLKSSENLDAAERKLLAQALTGAPVVDDNGRVIGVLNDRDIAELPEDQRAAAQVSDVMQAQPIIVNRRDPLDQVFDSMVTANLPWLPVRDRSTSQLAGIVTFQSILIAYRRALTRKVRRTQSMTVGSTLLEVQVTEASPLYHCPVREILLPDDALLVTYTRGGVVRFPHGDTVFESGDVVGVVTSIAAEDRIRRFLEPDGREPDTPVDNED